MPRPRPTLLLALTALAAAAVPAALEARPAARIATITVIAGSPRELAFTVSPRSFTTATVRFEVRNRGTEAHSFKLCTRPAASAKADACTGKATGLIAPGKTATLTVTLKTSGTYEYLSGIRAQAAAGMKGLVTLRLAPTAPSSTSSSSSSSSSSASAAGATTTTPSSSGTTGRSSGGVVNGQATDPACPPGTLVPVGPGAGDQDDDNEGGFPTDGDGCL